MTTIVRHGRATATSPGKHGPKDWKVMVDGRPVTIAEVVFTLGFILMAEERYDGPNHLGRFYLWRYVDALLFACKQGPDAVLDVVHEADADIRDWRRGSAA